jgi:hypothetical protein
MFANEEVLKALKTINKSILSVRFDLPFYLRLPSAFFFTWDPEFDTALILLQQCAGEVSFSKSSSLMAPERILDSPGSSAIDSDYKYVMTCITEDYGELPTLRIDAGPQGGFTEFRTFTEIVIYIVIPDNNDPFSLDNKNRSIQVINNFLDIYRIITQDPYM